MDIGGHHIRRTQTEIEKEDRIIIKTEIVDESYEQYKNTYSGIIDYKDIDPGHFVVKEEPQNESVGFISQIKTEDNLDLPNLIGITAQPENSSSTFTENVFCKTERIAPYEITNQPGSLDQTIPNTLEENKASVEGGIIYGTSNIIKENVDLDEVVVKNEDWSSNSLNLNADRYNSDPINPDKAGSKVLYCNLNGETGEGSLMKTVIVHQYRENYPGVLCESVKPRDSLYVLGEPLNSQNSGSYSNETNLLKNESFDQCTGNFSNSIISNEKIFSFSSINEPLKVLNIKCANKINLNAATERTSQYDKNNYSDFVDSNKTQLCDRVSYNARDINSEVSLKENEIVDSGTAVIGVSGACAPSTFGKADDRAPSSVKSITKKVEKTEKAYDYRKRVEEMIPKDKRFPVGDYKCYSCDKNFNLLSDWVEHMVLYLKLKGCYPSQSKSEYLNKREKALEYIVTSDDFFKCTICGFEQCKSDVIRHVVNVHNKLSLKCGFCIKTWGTYHSLNGHLAYQHNPLRAKLKCPHCTLQFIDKGTFKTHVNVIHKKIGYKCDICGRVCSGLPSLNRHVLRLHTDSFKRDVHKCPDCSFTSTSKQSLQSHITRKHRRDVEFACHYCQYKTFVKEYIARHIFNIHMTRCLVKKKYRCDKCGIKLTTEAGLNRHIRRFHGKKIGIYNCSHCSLNFKTKHDCLIHTNTEHLSVFKYKCNSCKFIGSNEDDFIKHVSSEHVVNETIIQYHCAYCPSINTSKHHVCLYTNARHNVDGVVRYKCTLCKYEAKTKLLFAQHVNVRHNPNAIKYTCYHCGHQNKIKHKLSQHMQTKHKDLLGRK